MAFNIIDTTYSGTYTPFFIMRATYAMDTVQKGLASIVGGIKKKHTIGRMDYNNPLKPRQAVPIATNTNPFTFDGRVIYPQSVDIYEEFNPRDFEENQVAEQLSQTILDRQVPQNLQSQLVQLVLNRAGEQYEKGLWQGSIDFSTVPDTDPRYQIQFFDGFLKRMVNDSDIIPSSISPVAITASNILSILDDLITQVTIENKALITDPKAKKRMRFVISPATANLYEQAITTGTTFKGNPFDIGYIAPWRGYKVECVAGMADNTVLFLRAINDQRVGNLYIGMNSMEDWQLKIMRTANANETFFIQGKFKWDVNYGWSEEIAMYTTLTTASFEP